VYDWCNSKFKDDIFSVSPDYVPITMPAEEDQHGTWMLTLAGGPIEWILGAG
jgi:hypothetical protein